MRVSVEMREKLDLNLKEKEDLVDRILSDDIEENKEAIGYIGRMSQKDISPFEVINSYENNTMDSLYNHAKQIIELREMYLELCDEVAAKSIEDANVGKNLRK